MTSDQLSNRKSNKRVLLPLWGFHPWLPRGVGDVGEARMIFLGLIPDAAPRAVMKDLESCLHSRDRASAIERWARKYHLVEKDPNGGISVPSWVVEQADFTLDLWTGRRSERIPEPVTEEFLRLARKLRGRSWIMILGYELDDVIVQREDEKEKHFEVRRRNEARRRGLVHPGRILREHFEWAIRFQLAEERICFIAADAERTEQDVGVAVNRVLKLVGLARRREPRGPIRR